MQPIRHATEVSGDHFRLLVESVKDYAIFMLDPHGIILSWNAGARHIEGYSREEIVGRPFTVFYENDAIASGWPQEELRRAAAQGRFEDEGWRLRRDGTRFWASVVITALCDPSGELVGFGEVVRDLTERRRIDEALRRSEEQLRLLVDAGKDYAIFLLDPEGRVRTWNAGAQAITGYTAGEVLDHDFSIFFEAHEAQAGIPRRELATALGEGRTEVAGWRVRKDGSSFWANTILTPVFDGRHVLRGFAKITRDLTEQRRLLELERSSRRMNEFLAMLAHELRNPLAPMRNALSILQMQPDLPRPALGAREIIDRQLDHMTRLVDDLLDLGRILTGKIPLQLADLDYRDVVDSSACVIRPLAEEHSQRLVVELPPQPVEVRGDAIRLAQCLQNLLQNAVRHTPAGGEIRVNVATDGHEIVTSVCDTGCGISRDACERIFELFVQEGSASAASGGLGIGLSLARNLVEQHGGRLTAHSEGLGRGSTFTIRLPRGQPGAPEAPRPPAAAEDACPPQRVLVVDDNRDSADTMVCLLTLLGHEALCAYGATHALEAAHTFRPRVVLLDLNMPDGDGFSTLARLRATLPDPVYAAAMTGYGRTSDRRSTREAGFQAHLTKPVSVDQLRQVLLHAAACRAPDVGAGTRTGEAT